MPAHPCLRLASLLVIMLTLLPSPAFASPEEARADQEAATTQGAKQVADPAKEADAAGAGEPADGTDKSTFQSDYNAKHFSLVAGALVLNPFKIRSVDTDMDPMTQELELEEGSTDAKLLLEAGFRRRWAWEHWKQPSIQRARRELGLIRSQLDAEQKKPAEAQSRDDIRKWQDRIIELEAAIRAEQMLPRQHDDPTAYVAGWPGPNGTSGLREWALDGLALLLLPDSYTVRLGFALGSDDASGAAGVAGGGDFYIETGLGLDWLRALYPAGVEPLRVGFGPELFATFSNDTEQDDFHQRYLAGGALTAGLPLGEGEERLAEIVVRAGWVSVEVPGFIDDSRRLIVVKNGRADFEQKSGFGVDVEMNIPITKELGYLFLRATSNHGFNPNPWTTSLGYTLPLDNLLGMMRP